MSKRRLLAAGLVLLGLGFGSGRGQSEDPVSHWSFDRIVEGRVTDLGRGWDDEIRGHYRQLPGVKGRALVFDGYTTRLIRSADQAPALEGDFTVEAWIALGAYPWNWAPIAAQESTVSMNSHQDSLCWPDDIVINSPKNGFFFGISPEGFLGLHIGAGGWRICRTESRIPLRTWVHTAAVYRQGRGVTLFVDGREAASLDIEGRFRQAAGEDLRIGQARQKLEPSHPVRPFATLPAWYSLDGLLDELRIHRKALDHDAVRDIYNSAQPVSKPDLPPRALPSGPPGPGEFGASYMRLEYYPEWDALWPVSTDPDIVVQFDDSPVRVVFWRGTRYGPAWVMDNDLWMGDQSVENFTDRDGCIEHMLDPRCRFSHVRIVENTPARVVVHWRYCPTSANGNHSQVDEVSGWEDWVDEYYTFYPDQVGIRKVILHSEGQFLWPEEVIGLCHPGQKPEDVVDLSAMTLVSLNGLSHTYTWADTTPKVREGDTYVHFGSEPEDKPVIMRVNFKSENKPFQVFETTNRFSIFTHELRKGVSHFPWWNHWPVAQVPSDGRYCQAADRASHFSLAWGGPPPHEGEDDTWWWAWMYGATREEAGELVPLARSWLVPPELTIGKENVHGRYDLTQRCYVLSGPEDPAGKELSLRIEADSESPVVNPAFLIENWGRTAARLILNGEAAQQGKDFRCGHIRRVNSYDLVVWIPLKSEEPVDILLVPLEGR